MQTFEKELQLGVNLMVETSKRDILPISGKNTYEVLTCLYVHKAMPLPCLGAQSHTEWGPAATEARPAGKSLSDWTWNLDRAALLRLD